MSEQIKAATQRWGFFVLTALIYVMTDLGTNIANFAGQWKDGAGLADVTTKEWVVFIGSSVASAGLMLRGLMNSSFGSAKAAPPA